MCLCVEGDPPLGHVDWDSATGDGSEVDGAAAGYGFFADVFAEFGVAWDVFLFFFFITFIRFTSEHYKLYQPTIIYHVLPYFRESFRFDFFFVGAAFSCSGFCVDFLKALNALKGFISVA